MPVPKEEGNECALRQLCCLGHHGHSGAGIVSVWTRMYILREIIFFILHKEKKVSYGKEIYQILM